MSSISNEKHRTGRIIGKRNEGKRTREKKHIEGGDEDGK
jgi:hypothetical protein